MTIGRTSARARRASEPLTSGIIESAARRLLPRRNDHAAIDSGELLSECLQFGIRTRGQFTRLLLRHRRTLRTFDQGPLTPLDQRVLRAEYGDAFVQDRMRRQYFFSSEGLVRTALEWEFGDAYVDFYKARDKGRETANSGASERSGPC
jgi:hypothetical protein